MHHRNAEMERSVVHQVAGGKVVAPIHHQFVTGHYLEDIVGGEPLIVGLHLDVGIESGQGLSRRLHL